jgi:hypothetical protein
VRLRFHGTQPEIATTLAALAGVLDLCACGHEVPLNLRSDARYINEPTACSALRLGLHQSRQQGGNRVTAEETVKIRGLLIANSTAARTTAATEAVQRCSAERAASDPAKLGRAVRIVRAAITAGHLAAVDLLPSDDRHEFAAGAR